MVKIAARDFNRDMGSYLEKRTAKSYGFKRSFSFKLPFKTMKRIDEEVPDIEPTEVHVEYKKPSLLKKVFSFRRRLIKETASTEDLSSEEMGRLKAMEGEIEVTEKEIVEKEAELREREEEVNEIKEEEEELVQKKESLVKKFFDSLNVFKKRRTETVEMPAEEEELVLDEDIIDVIKISHKWLEQLTPGKRRSFKTSGDFQKYREVLSRYGLIRK